jgi:hypothetical protein
MRLSNVLESLLSPSTAIVDESLNADLARLKNGIKSGVDMWPVMGSVKLRLCVVVLEKLT